MTLSPSNATYVGRHLGPNAAEREAMLEFLGYASLEDLLNAAVPADIRSEHPTLEPLSEEAAQAKLREYADKNVLTKSFYGQGFYDTLTPPVIRRNVVEDPGWYTAYTPYQPEISQGRLEALLNFQQMVMELTGLEVANASLLDEATAVAEAVGLMARASRKGNRVVLDERLHPQVISVTTARARTIGLEVAVEDLTAGLVGEDLIGVVLAYPGTEGDVSDISGLIEDVHSRGGLATVACDLLSLMLLKSPGSLGADIAVGSSQRFGVPLFFGGPHAGFMAATDKLKRSMPGRIVGVSIDQAGDPAYRLALQTREQHIRRERATSNICTAQALLAVVASMYAIWHGPQGLTNIARRVNSLASRFAKAAGSKHERFFDTVTVKAEGRAKDVAKALADQGILVRTIGEDEVSVAFGESATEADALLILKALGVELEELPEAESALPKELLREDEALSHPIFSSVHSETQMLRYLRALKDKDLALDRTMIPLGSCTMKLNPTAGMEPITWPEFAGIHPYAPEEHTRGWRELIAELEGWLSDITGYAQVSLQPNAGSQGEFAGLLAIRRYHLSRGEGERDVVLIPSSAHGTNAASAALANLKVAVVKTAEDGSIDLEDLDAKIEKHAGQIAGIMITYPSTHGVYEETVRTVCEKVHAAGGQVYIDGANLNALAGVARPGQFGGDVSHLNLHKTFTIPHGGGGPGVGPVCVAEHLVPFLPTDPNEPASETGGMPVSSALFGSAGVLPISWSYIAMMGGAGLRDATAQAVLSANYLTSKLSEAFPVLYTGANGLVAHECILDLRPLADETGVNATDVAKRLVDFGFHAPTLSFPVAGTLMVEPTESEDLAELDRFIEAMLTIREEIAEIARGEVAYEDSVVANAPYTAHSVISNNWDYSFDREKAAYPVPSLKKRKYFPPVRRLNEAYGDRNFMCSCPPIESYED